MFVAQLSRVGSIIGRILAFPFSLLRWYGLGWAVALKSLSVKNLSQNWSVKLLVHAVSIPLGVHH